MMNLKEKYKKEAVPAMKEKFGYKSVMAIPKIEKVVVNTCYGRLVTSKTGDDHKKFSALVVRDLSAITGQKPIITRAKKSIASFKLREGLAIGAQATLRGRKMYDFLDRIIHIALPRSRDFRGIDQKSFDKRGILSIGIKEHIIFPEVSPETAKTIFGLEVTIVTNTKNKEEGVELLKLLGFPIKK